MIHQVEGEFVISSAGGVWLSGCYESREAARLALCLPELTLALMQARANARMPGGVGGTITEAEVKQSVESAKRRRRQAMYKSVHKVAQDP